jgi:hypothetical protein
MTVHIPSALAKASKKPPPTIASPLAGANAASSTPGISGRTRGSRLAWSLRAISERAVCSPEELDVGA